MAERAPVSAAAEGSGAVPCAAMRAVATDFRVQCKASRTRWSIIGRIGGSGRRKARRPG